MKYNLRFVLACAGWVTALMPVLDATVLMAQTANSSLTLNAHPESLTLGLGETSQVLFVVGNDTTRTADSLTFAHVPCEGIQVLKVQPLPEQLLGGSSRAWLVELERTGQDMAEEMVFQLSSVLAAATTERESLPAATGVTTTRVTLQSATPLAMLELLEITLEATQETIQDYRSAELLLLINNKSDREVVVQPTTVAHPPDEKTDATVDLVVRPKTPLKTVRVGAHQQQMMVFEVVSPRRRVPGARIAALKVDFEWQEHGQTRKGSRVVSHKFELGIFGESAMLAAVGVPVFFLLPGFLCLTAFWAVVVRYWRELPDKFPLSTVEYGAVSVLLSFLAVPVYTRLMHVNYLERYELVDVGYLWFGSLAAGFLGAGLLVLVNLACRLYRSLVDAADAWRQFQDGDSPEEVIRKLEQFRRGPALPRTKVTEEGREGIALRLDDGNPGWVCPAIHCEFTSQADRAFQDDFESQLDAALQSGTGLYRLLRRRHNARRITLSFDPVSVLKGPRNRSHTPVDGQDALVELK